jgi:hypothetical protein
MYFEYKLTWNDIYKSFFIKFLNNVTVKVFLARLIDILYISLYIHFCTAIYDKTNLQSFLQSIITADVYARALILAKQLL